MSIFSKKKSLVIILMLGCLYANESRAQKIDTVSTFAIAGYLDAYYAYYTDSVSPGGIVKFPSISPRNNSPSLNTFQLSFLYNAEKVRGAAVFHFGDIAAATWAAEPYNHIMEAHVG